MTDPSKDPERRCDYQHAEVIDELLARALKAEKECDELAWQVEDWKCKARGAVPGTPAATRRMDDADFHAAVSLELGRVLGEIATAVGLPDVSDPEPILHRVRQLAALSPAPGNEPPNGHAPAWREGQRVRSTLTGNYGTVVPIRFDGDDWVTLAPIEYVERAASVAQEGGDRG